MNEEEDERSLKENSSNLANSSLLDALIFSSPLKNVNYSIHILFYVKIILFIEVQLESLC